MVRLAIKGGAPVRNKPFPKWPIFDEREIQAVTEVVKSGCWWAGNGTKGREFAEKFARFHDAKYGINFTNGTHTLEAALIATGVGPGDEVIVPGFTFIATATAVLAVNAIPVLVDVDPETFCLDPGKTREAITERTKAILPVHIAGHSADMDEIRKIAAEFKLVIIEDAAHAHGGEWKHHKLGALGNIGSFSFQGSKTLNAGEGGILITNDKDLYERCYSLVNCGRVPNREFYVHYTYGSNYRMTEFQAAILLSQFERLEEQVEIRNKNGLYLNENLKKIPGIIPQKRDERVTSQGYYLYMFRYDPDYFEGLSREKIVKALNAEGIPTQGTYPAVHQTPLFKESSFHTKGTQFKWRKEKGLPEIDYSRMSLPFSEMVANEVICLPQYVLLGNKADMDDVIEALTKIQRYGGELC